MAEEKIFTQEQHEQLLQAAIDKAVAEATSKMDGEVLRLNDQVEALQKDIEDRDTKVAELEKAISDRDEATRLEKLANERADKVKEKASFTDEQIEARKEGWAAMTDEAFTAYLEDLETVAAASASSKTKFDGTREAATDDEASAVRKLLIGEGN